MMLSRFTHLVGLARSMSLPILMTRGLHRLGAQAPWIRLVDFMYSPDTARPTKSVNILLNSMRQSGLPLVRLAAAIPGATVLEIGCGRHVGVAPFALGLGAKSYIGIDPALDIELLRKQEVKNRYLAPALQAARDMAAGLSEFQHLSFSNNDVNVVDETLARCQLVHGGIADWAYGNEKVDVCISISCLEHILDFAEASRVMATISHPGTIHIHVVNFSSHLSKQLPFHQLYEMPYAEFGRRWNHGINGLRISDMLKVFGDAGLVLRFLPLDIRPDALPVHIDSTWAERYSRDELALRTAVLTSL